MHPSVLNAKSDLGVAAKKAKNAPTPENLGKLEEARRNYSAARLAEHITRVVDAAPKLTDEQRSRLALLLRGAA